MSPYELFAALSWNFGVFLKLVYGILRADIHTLASLVRPTLYIVGTIT